MAMAMVAIHALGSLGIMTLNWKKFVLASVKETKASITTVAVLAVFMASYAEVELSFISIFTSAKPNVSGFLK
jgi:hypothetical protein